MTYYLKGLLITIVVAGIGYAADGIGLAVGFAVLVVALVLASGFIHRYATVYTIIIQRLRI